MALNYVPVLVHLAVTIVLISTIVFISSQIGHRKVTREKLLPYECGMDAAGSMEIHFPVRFYLVAMLFIIFDIETVFLYPWAVVYSQLGWFGFVEMFIFTSILLIGLVYLFQKGALEWE